MAGHGKPIRDRRIHKTEALLRNALGELVREKPYEEIVVKEILGRANVGRSTFYTHFAHKDELLVNCIHEMLGTRQPYIEQPGSARPEQMLWFSIPIFEHIERHRQTGQPGMDIGGRGALHAHLQSAIFELIEPEVSTALRRSGSIARRPSADLLVQWIASTFVIVLNWWVENECRIAALEADRIFRALVEPALASAIRKE